ncbi:MAG: hypothetical protein J3K34DRAFT_65343 [Monoraphidium minutum]|nr:MAG: hypothetical protein J3K34DRAFT_65343 [Monoraphidium minutum]
MTTAWTGSIAAAACNVTLCPAGTGGVACTICDLGSFSNGGISNDPKRECQQCPSGSYATRAGATSNSQCIAARVTSCPAGYIQLRVGTCHMCGPDTYSSGGSSTDCTSCPDNTITRMAGSAHISACVVPEGLAKLADGSIWATDPPSMFTQSCRSDLAGLFTSAAWDSWLAERVCSAPDSCKLSREVMAELQALWFSRIMQPAVASIFMPSLAADSPLNWQGLGARDYASIWGRGNFSFLGSWTAHQDMEGLFTANSRYLDKFGPLWIGILQIQDLSHRFTMLSYLNAALIERNEVALTKFSGQFSKAAGTMWMLIRKLRSSVEALIPALNPEGPAANMSTFVTVDTELAPKTRGGSRKLASSKASPCDILQIIAFGERCLRLSR